MRRAKPGASEIVSTASLEAWASLTGDPHGGVTTGANISLPKQGDWFTLPVEATWMQIRQTSCVGKLSAGCEQHVCNHRHWAACPHAWTALLPLGSITPPKTLDVQQNNPFLSVGCPKCHIFKWQEFPLCFHALVSYSSERKKQNQGRSLPKLIIPLLDRYHCNSLQERNKERIRWRWNSKRRCK